ncbi:MAG: ornithine cyclodeaminase family protein [Thermoanaerobaculia bacterium]
MTILWLDRTDVGRVLDEREALAAAEEAFEALARGDVVNPLRQAVFRPDRAGLVGSMPAFLADPPTFALKVVTVFPGAHAAGLDSHQGAVLLFDGATGRPEAILEAGELTARRTAAASALATRELAREDAGDLALLGAGVQARAHLRAIAAVRSLRRVRVWNRTPERAAELALWARSTAGLRVEPVGSARAAVEGADLVCTLTASAQPILEGAWLAPGCHVNAVGSCTPRAREVDAGLIRRARIVVDSRESALAEAGDLLLAAANGAFDAGDIVAELAEVVAGRAAGRTAADEITLYESLGLAIEDLTAARRAWLRADELGVGRRMEWPG